MLSVARRELGPEICFYGLGWGRHTSRPTQPLNGRRVSDLRYPPNTPP